MPEPLCGLREPDHYLFIGDKPLPQPLPDTDVIAEIQLLWHLMDRINDDTAAHVTKVIKTNDGRIHQNAKVTIKYKDSSDCVSFYQMGDKGTVVADMATDIDERLVLCPYVYTGNSYVKYCYGERHTNMSECVPAEIEAAKLTLQTAENGDGKARAAIGLMYEEGKNARQDDVKAMKWYARATHQSVRLSECNQLLYLTV